MASGVASKGWGRGEALSMEKALSLPEEKEGWEDSPKKSSTTPLMRLFVF